MMRRHPSIQGGIATPETSTRMPKTTHANAAEHHQAAEKSRRTAAEHHEKGDHAKASAHGMAAHGRSETAHKTSGDADAKSTAHAKA